ncbi:hypothetical protein RIF29_20632 [Crotalaria pallida]|uniref:T-complex protein 1 subunit alpha n=1 Tax=Crotalaria pallida TaxID=3830 RepID=A0AAN9F2Z2_CROPI
MIFCHFFVFCIEELLIGPQPEATADAGSGGSVGGSVAGAKPSSSGSTLTSAHKFQLTITEIMQFWLVPLQCLVLWDGTLKALLRSQKWRIRDFSCACSLILVLVAAVAKKVSLVLRGANDYVLDEMDRALHDALSIVKRTLESNTHVAFACPCAVECIPDHFSRVVANGGVVEAALSVYLEYLATTLGSREQLAIAEFAESLLIIPKVLSVNAAKDATELVAKLRAYHHTEQTKADKKDLSRNNVYLALIKI